MKNSKHFEDVNKWRKWLSKNYNKSNELLVIYYKKKTGIKTISYDESVEEALCYGWIDGLVKRIDDEKYTRKFTPRRDNSKWSPLNKKRIEKLIKENRLTEAGLAKVSIAKQNGMWEKAYHTEVSLEINSSFRKELLNNKTASLNFEQLSEACRKEYILWINTAKREETIQKRIKQSIQLLSENKKLGMK